MRLRSCSTQFTTLPILVLAALLAACQQKKAVWILSPSTVQHLIFVFGQTRGHEQPIQTALRVDRCDDPDRGWARGKALWIAYVDGSVRPYPSRIAYGKPVPGFVEQMAAEPLTPGCYFATTVGSGATAFTVDSFGVVRELDSIPPLDPAGQ